MKEYVMSQTVPGRKVYEVKLPEWNGPMDLLLDLIRDSEVNILDIPIAEITTQYLDAIRSLQKMDVEVAANFLSMAAYLIFIKSEMLRHPDGEDIEDDEFLDPRGHLVQQLLEYQKYKNLADVLEDQEFHSKKIIERRDNQITFEMPSEEDDVWQDVTLFELIKVFSGVIDVMDYDDFDVLRHEEINLEDKIEEIKALLKKSGKINFYDIFKDNPIKYNIIVTFSAILELYKVGHILIKQHQLYGDIFIFLREQSSSSSE